MMIRNFYSIQGFPPLSKLKKILTIHPPKAYNKHRLIFIDLSSFVAKIVGHTLIFRYNLAFLNYQPRINQFYYSKRFDLMRLAKMIRWSDLL